jgi:hypothetical protein
MRVGDVGDIYALARVSPHPRDEIGAAPICVVEARDALDRPAASNRAATACE